MLKATLLSSMLTLGALAQVGALTDQRIVDLTKAGLKEDELIRLVQTAPAVQFNLTPSFTDWMLEAGVTENVIKAMAGRESGTGYEPTASASPAPFTAAQVTPATPIAPVQLTGGHRMIKPLKHAVPVRHNVSIPPVSSGGYLSEQEVRDAIDSARRHRGSVGLTLNDIQENLLSGLACKTCGQSGYTVTIYTPFEWIEVLTLRADKEMLPFSAADITQEMRVRMLRVEALPSRPDYINGAGLSMSSSVHRVVLSDTGRLTIIQPFDLANGTVESNSAFRSATFSTAAAAFQMFDVDQLRALDSKREFFVVVVGDRQNKYFKVKQKYFKALFG